jgi:hypothetical protein
MRSFFAIYVLAGCCIISLAQTVTKPHGEGSVVFESAGGNWRKAIITDLPTGETATTYSLDASDSEGDTGIKRQPRIVFVCKKSGKFDGVRILTGTVVANQFHSVSDYRLGRTRISTRTDDQEIKTWTADIAKNGSDLLTNRGIISDFLAHKKFVIKFTSASGDTITDEYMIEDLSIDSLKADCPTFSRTTSSLRTFAHELNSEDVGMPIGQL